MISSLLPLIIDPARNPEVTPYDLTGKEERLQSVSELMSEIAADFTRHAKRSLPFLTRYRSGLAPSLPGLIGGADLPRAGGELPKYGLLLCSKRGGGWLGVWVNAAAINLLLEGALGGSALFEAPPAGAELSAPQRALVHRVTRSLVDDLQASVSKHTPTTATYTVEPLTTREVDGVYAVCEIENLAIPATVTVAVSSDLLVEAIEARRPQVREELNREMLDALGGVEVEMVAELGRVSISLGDATSLAVGDVIRLNTTAGDPIQLQIGGTPKFDAAPMTSRGQMAVEIKSRHGR